MRVRALPIILLLLAGAGLLALRTQRPGDSEPGDHLALPLAPASSPRAPSPSATPDNPSAQPAPEFADADAPPTAPGPNILGEWTGRPPISPWRVARDQARENAAPATRIPLRLASDRTGVMRVDGYQPTEEDGGVFQGTLEGHPGSTVILSYIGEAQAGVVLLPAEHRAYNFRAGDDGILRVTELDTRNAPDCGQPTVPLTPPRI